MIIAFLQGRGDEKYLPTPQKMDAVYHGPPSIAAGPPGRAGGGGAVRMGAPLGGT